MPRITEGKRNERKKLILNAALEVFAEKGYSSTSVEDIIKKADVSKGLIYTYFKSKEEIFLNLAEYWQEITQWNDIPEYQDLDINNKISENLLIIWDSIVSSWTEENLMFARLQYQFWLESSNIPELKEIMRKKSRKSLELIEKLISENNNKIDPEIINAFSRIWWSQVDGLLVYHISHGTTPNQEEMKKIRVVIKYMCDFVDE